MLAVHNPTQKNLTIVQALQRLTERLAAPDLTATEAQVLQPRLLSLLEALENANFEWNENPGDLTIACGSDWCVVA